MLIVNSKISNASNEIQNLLLRMYRKITMLRTKYIFHKLQERLLLCFSKLNNPEFFEENANHIVADLSKNRMLRAKCLFVGFSKLKNSQCFERHVNFNAAHIKKDKNASCKKLLSMVRKA